MRWSFVLLQAALALGAAAPGCETQTDLTVCLGFHLFSLVLMLIVLCIGDTLRDVRVVQHLNLHPPSLIVLYLRLV